MAAEAAVRNLGSFVASAGEAIENRSGSRSGGWTGGPDERNHSHIRYRDRTAAVHTETGQLLKQKRRRRVWTNMSESQILREEAHRCLSFL